MHNWELLYGKVKNNLEVDNHNDEPEAEDDNHVVSNAMDSTQIADLASSPRNYLNEKEALLGKTACDRQIASGATPSSDYNPKHYMAYMLWGPLGFTHSSPLFQLKVMYGIDSGKRDLRKMVCLKLKRKREA